MATKYTIKTKQNNNTDDKDINVPDEVTLFFEQQLGIKDFCLIAVEPNDPAKVVLLIPAENGKCLDINHTKPQGPGKCGFRGPQNTDPGTDPSNHPNTIKWVGPI